MIPYIGDFAEDATLYHYFNTFDSNDPSASVTITNLADTDIYVYKDGSVTDIVTDGASVVIDFDSRTGVHKLTIDTSVHADYATGSDYMVLIEGTTVDAGTVTAGIFTFSIENRYNAAADDLANGTDGLGALKTLIDTLTTNVGTVDTVVDRIEVDTQDLQTQIGTAGAGLTDLGGSGNNWNVGKTGYSLTATTGLGNQTANITGNLSGSVGSLTGHTVQTGDTYALANGATGFAAINTDVELILADTGELQTDWANGGRLDLILDTAAAAGSPPMVMQSTTISGAPGSQTSFVLAAGSSLDDAYNGQMVVFEDAATSTQKATALITGYVGSSRTVTLDSAPAITIADTDKVDIIAVSGSAVSLQVDASGYALLPTATQTSIDAIETDTTTDIPALIATAQADLDTITGSDGATLATAQALYAPAKAGDSMALAAGAVTDASLAGNMEIVFETDFATNYNTTRNAWATNAQDFVGTSAADPFNGQVVAASVTGAVGSVTGHTNQTGDTYALANGATGFAAIDTVVDAVKVVTDALGSAGAANLALSAAGIIGGATSGTPTTTATDTDLTGYADDELIGRTIIFTGGTADGQASDITDYANTSGVVTYTALTTAPAASDTFVIV